MKNAYVPVQSLTFVNVRTRVFRTVRLSLHNQPTVTQFWGSIGRGNKFTRKVVSESRESARELVTNTIDKLVDNGFVQVA